MALQVQQMHVLLVVLLVAIGFNGIGCDKSAKMCVVCRIVVSEANWAIQQVDPNKSITGGSFRVDPKGNQPYKKERKYARSETHLEELFDKICDKFNYYAELTKEDNSKHIVRTEGFDNSALELKDLILDREVAKALKYRCHDFLEDHIDDVISVLQKENLSNYEKAICVEETSVCSKKAISIPMEVLPEAEEAEESEEEDLDDKDPLEGKASAGLDDDFKTMDEEEMKLEKLEL